LRWAGRGRRVRGVISKAKTVDAFLAGLPAEERAVFEKVRAMFRKGEPGVVESMAYGMPSYKVGEQSVGAFNHQKQYLCLYVNPEAVDPHRKALKALKLDCGKSCIRFKQPEQLPLDLAEKMIAAAVKLAGA